MINDASEEMGQDREGDLGFTYLVTKSGLVLIRHHGREAKELRGRAAQDFLKKTQAASFEQQQLLMARVTGNYRRGNERHASQHDRNRT